MTTAVMLDLETLGTRPDCVIMTLGAIALKPAEFFDILLLLFMARYLLWCNLLQNSCGGYASKT